MIRLTLVMVLATSTLWAQSTYPVPKYPRNFSLKTKDKGPRPGSRVPNSGASSGEFQRTYMFPAGLRLLVRAPCGAAVSRKDLIERAELISEPDGSPVQIDWEPVGDKDVTFWAVIFSRKEVFTVPVRSEDGKYRPAGEYSQSKTSSWHIEKLSLKTAEGFRACLAQDEVDGGHVRKAVANVLIAATLRNFRGQSSPGGI